MEIIVKFNEKEVFLLRFNCTLEILQVLYMLQKNIQIIKINHIWEYYFGVLLFLSLKFLYNCTVYENLRGYDSLLARQLEQCFFGNFCYA